MAKTPEYSRAASWSLWLGIAGFILGWIPIIGWGLVLAAIITGAIGISETAEGKQGRGRAIAGLILGLSSIIFIILGGILIAGLLFATVTSELVESGVTMHTETLEGDGHVRISGVGQTHTVDKNRSIELIVEGVNLNVTVADGTTVTSLHMEGVDNSVSLPAGSNPAVTRSGVNNHVTTR